MDTVAGFDNQNAPSNSWNELEGAFLEKNHVALIKTLKNGASPDLTDDCGSTLLMHACGVGSLVFASILISFGATVDHRNNDGECALGYLCSYNDSDEDARIEIAKILIAFSINRISQESPKPLFSDIASGQGLHALAKELTVCEL